MTESVAPRPPGLLALLGVVNANGILAATMYLPSLPSLSMVLGVPVDAMPFTLMVYLAAYAGGQLVFGPLSDRWGRRWLMLGSLAVLALVSAACAFVTTLEQLCWLRAIQGFAASAGLVIGRAVLFDVYNRAEAARATAVVTATLALAPIFSPLLGGLVQEFIGWRGSFLISAAVTAGALVLLCIWLGETHRPVRRQGSMLGGILRDYSGLLASRAFLGFGGVIVGIFAGLHSFNAAAPAVLIETLGLRPAVAGLLLALGGGGFFLGSLFCSLYAMRLGTARLIELGIAAMLLGGCSLPLLTALLGDSVAVVIGCRIVWAAGMGIAVPAAVAGATGANPKALGAGSALAGFMQNAAGGLGAMVMGLLPAGNTLTLGLAYAATALLGWAGWMVNRRAALAAINSPD